MAAIWFWNKDAPPSPWPDPLHPFPVASHGSLVVATGTQFGVEWLGNQTRVVLYEGHVAILRKQGDRLTPGLLAGAARDMPADSMLTPGREAVVNDGQTGINVHDLPPLGERAWNKGRSMPPMFRWAWWRRG
jgi:transmembrane sensor